MNAEDHAGVRLDKWLWATRFYKSRTLAVTAVDMGRVHLNNERVKPARLLRVGDKVSIQKDQICTEVFVRFLGEVRKSAPLAKLMYEETVESLLARQTATERKKLYAEPAQNRVGRPTKRERRALTRIEPID
jgi:ribosome-associated heat shock protein Hsp15